jgi:hypothetical protein
VSILNAGVATLELADPVYADDIDTGTRVLPASGTRTAWPCLPSISPLPKSPPWTQLIVEPFRQCGQDMSL